MRDSINQIIDSLLGPLAGLIRSLQEWLSPILPEATWAAYLAFALYVLIILGGGFMAILARNLVRAMLGLVLAFLGVAGMYLLLNSPFLAFMQLLIYVGAICVLIFFAIMLTRNTAEGEEARFPSLPAIGYGLLAFIAPLLVCGPIIALHSGQIDVHVPLPSDTGVLGQGLLSAYVIPFELISIILLVAMAGAVYLGFRGFAPRKKGQSQ
ncbi:MAG: NADH-quinone oxidoreductase subunit J [Deltaproteobacteria bacterium]|jgi:NADH-quinone oxidoreductase subunit J|nr:NADH-quinone oxidoreductase subunit J [Deltaproteobacteria bacterium]